MNINHRLLISICCVLLPFIFTACGGSGGGDPNNNPPGNQAEPSLVSLSIQASSITIEVGQTLQLSAIGHYSDSSTQDLTASVDWTARFTNILSVGNGANDKGLVSAKAVGNSDITAKLANSALSAVINIVVAPISNPVVISIDVRDLGLNAPTIPLGKTILVTALAHYNNGTTKDVSKVVDWSIADSNFADINNSDNKGFITSKKVGSTQVIATDPVTKVSGSATLTINPAVIENYRVFVTDRRIQVGKSQELKLFAQYSDKSLVDVSEQTDWSSSDSNILTVSNTAGSKGLVTSVSEGSVTVNYQGSAPLQTGFVTIDTLLPMTPQVGELLFTDNFHGDVVRGNIASGKMQTLHDIHYPMSIAMASNGKILAIDAGEKALIEIDPVNKTQTLVSQAWYISEPSDMAIDGNDVVYIADVINNSIFSIDTTSGKQHLVSVGGLLQGYLNSIAIEADGSLLVSNTSSKIIVRVNPLTGAQQALTQAADGLNPNSITVAKDSTIYATNYLNGKIYSVDPGNGASAPISATTSIAPATIAAANDGKLYVTFAYGTGVATRSSLLSSVDPLSGVVTPLVADSTALANIEFAKVIEDGSGDLYMIDSSRYGAFASRAPTLYKRTALSGSGYPEIIATGGWINNKNRILYTGNNEFLELPSKGITLTNLIDVKRRVLCCDQMYIVEATITGNGDIVFATMDYLNKVGEVHRYNAIDGSVDNISAGNLLTNIVDIRVDNSDSSIWVLNAEASPFVRINPVDGSQLGMGAIDCGTVNRICSPRTLLQNSDGSLLVLDGLANKLLQFDPLSETLSETTYSSNNFLYDMIWYDNSTLMMALATKTSAAIQILDTMQGSTTSLFYSGNNAEYYGLDVIK